MMRPLLAMRWRDACFAHWRVDPERLRAVVPPQLELDAFAGETWISVVAFRLDALRPVGAPVAFARPAIAELNLRTYVRAGGLPGVFFVALDAASRGLVSGARAAGGLAYRLSEGRAIAAAGEIRFTSRLRGAPGGAFAARYRPQGPLFRAAGDSLDAFLHERYRFFTVRAGRVVRGEVAHPRWPLADARIAIEENAFAREFGFALPAEPDLRRFAYDVDVRAAAPAF